MELEQFLTLVARATTAIVFTGFCAMVIVLFSVYGGKITYRAVKRADQNLDRVRDKVVKLTVVEKKQKRAKA